jgi:hypothetical protein
VQAGIDASERAIIESKITRENWTMELERVAPRLKVHGQFLGGAAADWGTRLAQMHSHRLVYAEHKIGGGGGAAATTAGQAAGGGGGGDGLCGHLGGVSGMAREDLSRIKRHEDRVNTTVEELKNEYTAIAKVCVCVCL